MEIELGEIRENNKGTRMKIIRYRNSEDIDVEFLDEYHYIKQHQTYSNFTDVKDAFCFYKQQKEKNIKEMADLYKDKIPLQLYKAMYQYEVEISD